MLRLLMLVAISITLAGCEKTIHEAAAPVPIPHAIQ